MRPLFLALIVSLFPMLLSAAPAARLKWDKTEVNIDAPWESEQTVAEFTFTNMSQEPVSILDIRTNCGCTTAELDKKTYEPGESGTIVATFEHGDRQGHQRKMIAVLTDENGQTGYPLVMDVDIPAALTLQPQQLQWRKGGHPVPQTIDIQVHEGFPGKVVKAAMFNPRSPFEVSDIKKISNKHYQITITPTSTKHSAQEAGAVASDVPADHPKVALFYLLIR